MGVVMDSKYILEWVMKKVNGTAPVFVWGHSLGTGWVVLQIIFDDKEQFVVRTYSRDG